VRAAQAVVARQANKQKTNKRRTKDEQKTNKRRTKDEQKTVRAARADKEKANKKWYELHGQIKKR